MLIGFALACQLLCKVGLSSETKSCLGSETQSQVYSSPPPQDMTWASLPRVEIDCVFIVSSDDDGTHFIPPGWSGRKGRDETVEECQALVNDLNRAFACANIHIRFDPATGYQPRHRTAYNRWFDAPFITKLPVPVSVLSNPAKEPPTPNLEEYRQARHDLAKEFPGKLIFVLMDAYHWNFNSEKKLWEIDSSNGGVSGGLHFPIMLIGGVNGPVVIHELGHTFGLGHTHKAMLKSIAEYRSLVEKELSNGKSIQEAMTQFDGDGIEDTPPDPGRVVYAEAGHQVYRKDGPFAFKFKGPNGIEIPWHLEPNSYLWMSYHREVRNVHPSTHQVEGRFSKMQAKRLWFYAGLFNWLPVVKVIESGKMETLEPAVSGVLKSHNSILDLEFAEICRSWSRASPLLSPASIQKSDSRANLVDTRFEKATVGWGEVMRNRTPCYPGTFPFLSAQDEVFKSGFFAHAPSEMLFDLGGSWNTLTVDCGVQQSTGLLGSVKFCVYGDGKLIGQTSIVKGGQLASLDLKVSGVKKLSLVASDAGDGNNWDWALWLNPRLHR